MGLFNRHYASLLTLLVTGACSSPPAGAAPGQRLKPRAAAEPAPIFSPVADSQILPMSRATLAMGDTPSAPMSLTATDGSGIVLTRVDAKAVVEGPLAYTELNLYFHNPEPRVREGHFDIALPAGAALSRFAMETDGHFMEAELVEQTLARRAYEDFLHRKQDPALLEKAAGNQFSARVFPIPANGDKHIVISYSQELTSASQPYVLPLRGLPKVDEVNAKVMIAAPNLGAAHWQLATLQKKQWTPDRDFGVVAASPVDTVVRDGMLASRGTVPGTTSTKALHSLAILVDTSASRALGFDSELRELIDIVAALRVRYGDNLALDIAAFDQTTAPVFHGTAASFNAGVTDALRARKPLGASDLGRAVDWATANTSDEQVLVIGDGVVTAGQDAAAIGKGTKTKAPHVIQRLDVALVGALYDRDAMRLVTTTAFPEAGMVMPEGSTGEDIARRIGLPVAANLPITVDGANWSWPMTANSGQPGDQLVVYAQTSIVPGQSATLHLGANVANSTAVGISEPLLHRALAGADIARMEAALAVQTDASKRTALKEDIVKRSVQARVLSSLTSFLVLESDADYQRFGIGRNALADILVVTDHGMELQQQAVPKALIAIPDVASDLPKGKFKTATATTTKKLSEDGKDRQSVRREKADPQDLIGSLSANDDSPGAASNGNGTAMALDEGRMDQSERLRTAANEVTEGDEIPTAGAAPADRPRPMMPAATPAAEPAPPPVAAAPARLRNTEVARDSDVRPVRASGAGSAGMQHTAAATQMRAMAPSIDRSDESVTSQVPALNGDLATIMDLIAHKKIADALTKANAWRSKDPGDVLALIALGEVSEAKGDLPTAARAYGSIIDLFPARADLRRFAGERLERLGDAGRTLAIDTYTRAVADRPDHLTGHRLLAFALVRAGRLGDAFAALEVGLAQQYPSNRFRGGERVLREDLGLVGAAWLAKEPSRRAEVMARLSKSSATLATESSLRFVLYWETDDNDVDFHIHDSRGNHAFYGNKELASGGALYEDITTGYGPECFTINGKLPAAPYHLQIHYYSRGPMGYGMGVLEIIHHDGKGGLTFEHRPYVVMNDHAFVDLGTVGDSAPIASIAK